MEKTVVFSYEPSKFEITSKKLIKYGCRWSVFLNSCHFMYLPYMTVQYDSKEKLSLLMKS